MKYLSRYIHLSRKLQREGGETFVRIVVIDRKTKDTEKVKE